MYAKFFGLKHPPFSIAPDPRYLFMSDRHREALAHLLYGLKGGGGFVLLTGEIGAGKTTVCRCFLDQVPPRCNVAYIFNPRLTVPELLQTICEEFRIPVPTGVDPAARSPKAWTDALNEFLLRTHAVGQINVLIIDEAQNLAPDVLEQLRLLTNLETTERKLLQIILIGQPELRDMLAHPELEQLAQRVIARYHLGPLDEADTGRYVLHRLGVAGSAGSSPFDKAALRRIHQLSRGVPRRINLLCDRALLGGYATGRPQIGADIVEKAAAEVFSPRAGRATPGPRDGWRRLLPWAGGALAGGVAASLAVALWPPSGEAPAPAPTAAAAAPAPAISTPASAAWRASGPVTAAPRAAAVLAPAALRATWTTAGTDEAGAWRELARAWQLDLPAAGDPCVLATRAGVPCYRSASSLAEVRQLDRPGVVVLYDDQARPYHVLLVALDDERATLRRDGRDVTVALASLGAAWRGEYGTLWRAPPGYAGPASLQSPQHPASGWLRARLDRAAPVAGAPVAAGPQALAARVAAFQVTHGLPPDGVAGPLTLMQLNRATAVEEPRLVEPEVPPSPAPATMPTPASATAPASPAAPLAAAPATAG
ncbi:AAA family ATPase [Ideonella sp.]|uniref:ExeA family protein n=1 Tax=Ideonella sp. TaxID=1929293 RepID=UPI0035AF8B82